MQFMIASRLSFRDRAFLLLVRWFIHLHVACLWGFGWRLPGISFLLRRLRTPFLFRVKGRVLFFNPRAAVAYYFLIGGFWNEPETHALLKTLLEGTEETITFIDVGASIGAMVIDAAGYPSVGKVIAFEPQPDCAEAVEAAAAANGYSHIHVLRNVVCEYKGKVRFARAPDPSQAHIATPNDADTFDVGATTLDEELDELDATTGPYVMLIDTEGSELGVMKGGAGFIARCAPLIVFEYNWLGRRQYTLDEVRAVLGAEYDIYRLRQDGRLDRDLGATDNCVAVPSSGSFCDLLQPLMPREH